MSTRDFKNTVQILIQQVWVGLGNLCIEKKKIQVKIQVVGRHSSVVTSLVTEVMIYI